MARTTSTAVQVKESNTWYYLNPCTKVLSERKRHPLGHENAENSDTPGGCPKGTGTEENDAPGRGQAGARQGPGRGQAGARKKPKEKWILEHLPTANRHSLLNIQRVQGWGRVTCRLPLLT